jgi:hypothetical protein
MERIVLSTRMEDYLQRLVTDEKLARSELVDLRGMILKEIGEAVWKVAPQEAMLSPGFCGAWRPGE